MSDWFVVADIDKFTDKARAIVFNNFGLWENESELDNLIDTVAENEQEELDKVLSHQESLIIVKQNVKKQKHKFKDSFRYLLNEKLFVTIVEDLNSRMVSNIINNLVQKGLVETAFDVEENDFIFWVKEEDKPETD